MQQERVPTVVVEDRLHNVRKTGRAVPLTTAVVRGQVDGWTVESQRRGADGDVLVVRLIDPTLRCVTITSDLSSSATNARGPVSTLLSDTVGEIFRDRQSGESALQTVGALRRLHTWLWDNASTTPAPGTLPTVPARSHGLTLTQVATYRADVLAAATQAANTTTRALSTPVVAAFLAAGITAEDAATWFFGAALERSEEFPFRRAMLTQGPLMVAARFIAAGWNPGDYFDLRHMLRRHASGSAAHREPVIPASLATTPPMPLPLIELCLTAGLTLVEAARGFRAGTLAEGVLRAMASLRTQGHHLGLAVA